MLFQVHIVNAEVGRDPQSVPNSCIDLLKSGENTNGYSQIAGTDEETWTVYCDFTSEMGSAWTLVMSWSFKNAKFPAFRTKAFTQNAPVNEQTPNWMVYRMSKDRMDFLKTKSSHWRATCSFNKFKVDYRDYMRGNFGDFDVTSFLGGGTCKKVEYVNIRGLMGQGTVPMWQAQNGLFLHTDSTVMDKGCDIKGFAGAKSSEDNFGYYGVSNRAFRCSASNTATTQYWFGSYL